MTKWRRPLEDVLRDFALAASELLDRPDTPPSLSNSLAELRAEIIGETQEETHSLPNYEVFGQALARLAGLPGKHLPWGDEIPWDEEDEAAFQQMIAENEQERKEKAAQRKATKKKGKT